MSTKLYLVVTTQGDGTKIVEGVYSSILKADASVSDSAEPTQMIFTIPVNESLPTKLGSLVFSAPKGPAKLPLQYRSAVEDSAKLNEYEPIAAGL